jgi:hypothetical protein
MPQAHKIRWPFARRRARPTDSCIACGQPIVSLDDSLAVHGELFHAACVLYSRRRR